MNCSEYLQSLIPCTIAVSSANIKMCIPNPSKERLFTLDTCESRPSTDSYITATISFPLILFEMYSVKSVTFDCVLYFSLNPYCAGFIQLLSLT